MNTLTLILASVLTTCVAQVLYALVVLKEHWYSTPVRWAVAVLCVASSGGALWFVLSNLMGGESLLPAFVFVFCQALAVTLVVGSGLRGVVSSGNLVEERAKRLQETANEANKRLKDMQELATGVRERLEEESTAIRERLEEQATGVRERLEERDTRSDARQDQADEERIAARMGRDTNTRIREMQEREQHDRPEERTDRKEGHEHRSDIDARLEADTETRSRERQDDREERADERQADREERADERREEE